VEPDLTSFIENAAGEPGCDFCGQEDAATCSLRDLVFHIRECIEQEFTWAANSLSWESASGGWIGAKVWDTRDLLTDVLGVDLPRDQSGKLLDSLLEGLGGLQDWCDRNPYGMDTLDELNVGWASFCSIVQHHTRFFLDRWKAPRRIYRWDEPLTPQGVLSAIGDRINRLELIREVTTDVPVFRVRFCEHGEDLRTPEQLGPPSHSQAIISNRMSPPGIVMFYGALNPETALAETVREPGKYAIGQWRVRRPTWMFDFSNLPNIPGFFAEIPDSQMWSWRDAQFFHDLIKDFSRPIARDDRVHIEYIPTQVVTEYCRLAYHEEHKSGSLGGIIYPSARSRREALVLFADRSAVLGIDASTPSDATWLELVDVEYRQLTERDILTFQAVEGR